MKVKFVDVGRTNASFEANCESLSYGWLYKKVKPFLLSRDIEFYLEDDEKSGSIFAGFRNVGKFEILED